MTSFNKENGLKYYNVDNERDLRSAITGERSCLDFLEKQEIFNHILSFENPSYAEIGVYFGGTFSEVLDFLRKNKKHFNAVGFDLFEDIALSEYHDDQTHDLVNKWNILNVAYKTELEEKLKKLGHTNFTLIKGPSEKCMKDFNGIFDIILIDGNHAYKQVKLDFEASLTKCRKGSIIIFDNSSDNINPDPQYVARDGGPWLLCQELKKNSNLEFLGIINRSSFFRVLE